MVRILITMFGNIANRQRFLLLSNFLFLGINLVKALDDVQDITAEQLKSSNDIHNNWNEDVLVEFKDITKEDEFHPEISKMISGEVDNRSDNNPNRERE